MCGVLYHDSEGGGVPSSRISINCPQRRLYPGKFHVQTFSLRGRGAAGGEGAAAPLKHGNNSHAGGASSPASEDGALFQKY